MRKKTDLHELGCLRSITWQITIFVVIFAIFLINNNLAAEQLIVRNAPSLILSVNPILTTSENYKRNKTYHKIENFKEIYIEYLAKDNDGDLLEANEPEITGDDLSVNCEKMELWLTTGYAKYGRLFCTIQLDTSVNKASLNIDASITDKVGNLTITKIIIKVEIADSAIFVSNPDIAALESTFSYNTQTKILKYHSTFLRTPALYSDSSTEQKTVHSITTCDNNFMSFDKNLSFQFAEEYCEVEGTPVIEATIFDSFLATYLYKTTSYLQIK